MKEIIIDNEGNVSSDIVDELCNIELTQDVILVTPYTEDFNHIEYAVDDFNLFNKHDIRPDKHNNYTFYPLVKMCLPEGLKPIHKCEIFGTTIINERIEKLAGVEVDMTIPNLHDLKLEVSAIRGSYSIYNQHEVVIKEYNREQFLKYLGSTRGGLKIPKGNCILSMFFIETFVGGERPYYNEIYLIRSDYLYKQFPNFGG